MKKTMNIMLSLLIIVSFSLHVSSQSAQKDLDQVKLVKQFLGTWKSEIGKDSILVQEIVPAGKGLYSHYEWKSQGKTYKTAESFFGFTRDEEFVVHNILWRNGTFTKGFGKFVSEKKLVMDRFDNEQIQAMGLDIIEFISPDTYVWSLRWRGDELTYDSDRTATWEMTKVKE